MDYLSARVTRAQHLGVDHQIRDDPVLLQVGISFLAISIFHLVGAVQVLQRHRGDVDSPANHNKCAMDGHQLSESHSHTRSDKVRMCNRKPGIQKLQYGRRLVQTARKFLTNA